MTSANRSVPTRPTEFTCEAASAQSVLLVGDFNQWSIVAHPMKRSDDGTWIATVPLTPGRYEYKFVVDGQWCCEPGERDASCGGPDRVPNSFGTMNRVIEIQ